MLRPVTLMCFSALVAFGGGAAGLYYYSRPTVLRVAAPQNSEDFRLVAAASHLFAQNHENVRLRLVPVADVAAGASALERNSVDLAVVRADVALPASAQTIVILHRNAALLIASPSSRLKKVSDLRGRRVGVVHESSSAANNVKLFETILAQYDMSAKSLTIVPLSPEEAHAAASNGKVDALFAVAVPQRELAKELVGAFAAQGGKPPVFIPISEAKAISKRFPALEPMEIVQGAFGGDPPRPETALDSGSVSVLMVSTSGLKDSVAGELARLLFFHRAAIAQMAPVATAIEAPSTDKGAAVPTHQGVADYIDGNEHTFFDKYSDAFYIAAMMVSLLGSGAAAIFARLSPASGGGAEALTERLLVILREARDVASMEEVETLEQSVYEIVCETLTDKRLQSASGVALHMLSLALDETRRALADRRRELCGAAEVVAFPGPRKLGAAE